jgi:enoyl-CoA hydratase/carnithine racemase
VLSLIVAGRLATVFAKAIAGEFAQARATIVDPEGRWGAQDPLPRRFDLDRLTQLLTTAGFTIEQARGAGILSHLVPASRIDSDADRAALDELDDLLVRGPGRETLGTLGSALHVIARRD